MMKSKCKSKTPCSGCSILTKSPIFMLENDTRSFGFVDLNERASYSAFLTEEEDGRQMLTIKKTFVKEKK